MVLDCRQCYTHQNVLINQNFMTLCGFRTELEAWGRNVELLLRSNKEACHWLVELLAGDKGLYYLKYVRGN